jgi:Family of unknown function (DUF6098)
MSHRSVGTAPQGSERVIGMPGSTCFEHKGKFRWLRGSRFRLDASDGITVVIAAGYAYVEGVPETVKARHEISILMRVAAQMLLKLAERICATEESPASAPLAAPPLVTDGSDLPVVDDLVSVTQLVKQRSDLFLRYSKGPTTDADTVSRDYEAGVDLPGLSVTTIAPEPWWPRPIEDWVARRICKYAELGEQDDRFPWLLSGRHVANGPDHEPIVELHEPIARLTPQALHQAKQWYRRRFEVGQDSTA